MLLTQQPSDEEADVFDRALKQLGFSEWVVRSPGGNTLTWDRPIAEHLDFLTLWASKGDHPSHRPITPLSSPSPPKPNKRSSH